MKIVLSVLNDNEDVMATKVLMEGFDGVRRRMELDQIQSTPEGIRREIKLTLRESITDAVLCELLGGDPAKWFPHQCCFCQSYSGSVVQSIAGAWMHKECLDKAGFSKEYQDRLLPSPESYPIPEGEVVNGFEQDMEAGAQ